MVACPPPARPPWDWTVRPDGRRRQQGRGAYVHPVSACVHQAIQRKALGRALRMGGRPDTSELEAWLAQPT
ncbi:MAG: YlxR family protein [Actinomycetota bacterium]|nr:YlxR family protein [Actinomycetota bacterium]